MKLAAGLTAPSTAWEATLSQEGFPWKHLPQDEEWFDMCSVLVITRRLEGAERDRATRFLQRGGSILGSMQHLNGLGRMHSRPAFLGYLVSDGDAVFPYLRLLDLGLPGEIPSEAHHLRTDANEHAVFAGELGGGVGVVLPFELQLALTDSRMAARAFYSSRDRLPSERVSLAGRGEIRHLVRSALSWLHRVRGLPYAHLWYYPGQSRTVASLRVDTDGSPREDIDTLYGIMHDAGVRGTWFLDVRAHEQWLPHFHSLQDQEIGLHCYEHRFGNDVKADGVNVRKGADLLQRAGWQVRGFAAPFGTWTPAHGSLIDSLNVAYSSEFGCGYDTLPFVPQVAAGPLKTLQVPVHPISIGSLLRTRMEKQGMQQYYEETSRDLLARGMPLFFYHHPTHRQWDVVRSLVNLFDRPGILKMSLGEYARWWEQRSMLDVGMDLSGSHILVKNGDLAFAADVYLHVVQIDGRESIVPADEPVSLNTLRSEMPHPVTIPEDLRRIRDVDPRRMLGELYAAMLRRLK
jgi:hypothetical protein